jgi:drug/metabolite transporter (DMT)-like permease
VGGQRSLYIDSPDLASTKVALPVARPVAQYLLLTLTMAIWGGGWVAKKIMVSAITPFLAGFLRFIVGGLLLSMLLLGKHELPQRPVKWSVVRLIVTIGTLGIFVYATFEFIGVGLATAVQGSIIDGFCPTTIAIFAMLMHGERFDNRWKYLGLPVSFLGVAFVVGVQALIDFRPEYFLGDLVLIAGAVLWGFYSALVKQGLKFTSTFKLTTGAVLVGTTLFGLSSFLEGSMAMMMTLDPTIWFCALYLGAGSTFVGYILYYNGIKKLGATRAGIFLNLVPVFGTVSSVLVLGDQVYWTFLVGLILVLVGVALINLPDKKP